MSDIYCSVCGFAWEQYGLHHEMTSWQIDLFYKHAGCPECEGDKPDHVNTEDLLERIARHEIFDGSERSDYASNLFAITDENRPRWIQPEDPTLWECEGCHGKIKRNIDPNLGIYAELYWEHKQAQQMHHWPSELDELINGIDEPADGWSVKHDAPITVPDELTIDGVTYCPLCATACDECGEIVFAEDTHSDPRNPYANISICTDCLYKLPTCGHCSECVADEWGDSTAACSGGLCEGCAIRCDGKDCTECDGWKVDPEKYYAEGCYADGSKGHNHIRSRLAELVIDHGIENDELVGFLRADMSDDASEELDAIDAMNELVPHNHDCTWQMIDGDLMFVE